MQQPQNGQPASVSRVKGVAITINLDEVLTETKVWPTKV